MKTLACLVSLILGISSYASTELDSDLIKLESGQSSNCLDAVEPVLAKVTHPSSLIKYLPDSFSKKVRQVAKDAKEAALFNVSIYESWAKEAKQNAENGFSNAYIQKQIEQSIQDHASDTVLIFNVGKAIGNCVRANLNFSSSATEQIKTANAFLEKAAKIRKAVN